MKVSFLIDFDGYNVGDVAEFVPFRTDDLLNRKIVKPYNDASEKDAEIADLKKQITTLKGQLTKQMKAAPVDKQFKRSAKDK